MGFLRDMGSRFDELMFASNAEIQPIAPAAEIVTAGAATYLAENILRGFIDRDPTGAARSDVMPTAALMVAAIANKFGRATVGMCVYFMLVNSADAAEAITVTAGAGSTLAAAPGTMVVGQNASRYIGIRLTNVGAGTEAYTYY